MAPVAFEFEKLNKTVLLGVVEKRKTHLESRWHPIRYSPFPTEYENPPIELASNQNHQVCLLDAFLAAIE